MEPIEIEHEGRRYRWDGKRWIDPRTNMVPPASIAQALNRQAEAAFASADDRPQSVQALISEAKAARDAGHCRRAERLIKKTLERDPSNIGALSVYTSTLRDLGEARKALEVSEPYRRSGYPPLLASRAAALCDLMRWEEAKREIGRALAIVKDDPAAFAVVHRIKSERPDLYAKE